jgi:hypothetical protein
MSAPLRSMTRTARWRDPTLRTAQRTVSSSDLTVGWEQRIRAFTCTDGALPRPQRRVTPLQRTFMQKKHTASKKRLSVQNRQTYLKRIRGETLPLGSSSR